NAGYITNKATVAGLASGVPVVSTQVQASVFSTGGCVLGYPYVSVSPLTSVAFNESDVLAAMAPNFAFVGGTIRAWYNDEHAVLLGIRQITVKKSTGTTTTNYPITPWSSSLSATGVQVGAQALTGDQAAT